MGVYKPKRKDKNGALKETPYFHYDFTIGGERFFGSTGQTSRRAAEAFEERKRKEVADGTYYAKEDDPADMTFDVAAGIYWKDIGSQRRAADGIERDLEVLVELIGKDTRIGDIKTRNVRQLMADRREGKAARTQPNPSPATMNRLLECLRATLNHIAEEREAALPHISWKRLMAKEPSPPERTFSHAELAAWADHLDELERFFLIVKFTYGPRLGELFMPPSSIVTTNQARPVMKLGKYFGRKVREVRKDGTLLEVVLLPEDAELLTFLAQRAAKAGLDHIWAKPDADGRLKPVNYYTMRRRLQAGARAAGIAPGRVIHSLRHHAASALVDDSGDIALARRALGHSSITTTQRYTHVQDSKLLSALARISRTGPERPLTMIQQDKQNQADKVVPPPGLEPGNITPEQNAEGEENQ